MGNLEEVGTDCSAAVQDLGLDPPLNVAGEQEAAFTKLKTESQRIIVSRNGALARPALRVQEFKLSRVKEEVIPSAKATDAYRSAHGSLEKADVFWCQRVFAHPEFTHLKIVQECMKSGHVVVVRVCQCNRVQLPHAQ